MKQVIAKMVELARLYFPKAEVDHLAQKTEHVLQYVEQLKELDTSNIEATSHAIEVVNAFREDAVQKFPNTEKILEIAPGRLENLFEVPKVIE